MAKLHGNTDCMTLLGFGEVMLEFRESSRGNFAMGCAGDVFNTLATAKKYGVNASFFSSLGDDFFLEQLKEQLAKYSVDFSECQIKKQNNAIYFVRLKDDGHREFQFYRKGSAACHTETADINALKSYHALYTSAIASGISQSCSEVVDQLITKFSTQNKKVFYDLNYRKQLWTLNEAAENFKNISQRIDTLFLSEDELDLVSIILGESLGERQAVEQLSGLGPKTVILRLGSRGALAYDSKLNKIIESETKRVKAVDTTGAGDVFAGAYIASLSKSNDVELALREANNAALQKVQKLGTLNFLLE